MSFLSGVTTKPSSEGQRMVIYGLEGIGKTTLACQAPNSLLIPLEQGAGKITSARLNSIIQNWNDVEKVLEEIRIACVAGKFSYKSIVWDSATALERLIHNEVLNRDIAVNKNKLGKGHSMETSYEGYGKAYAVANDIFATWLKANDELARCGGINIVVTCHAFVVRATDPSAGEYDTFELLMHSPKNNKTYGKREHLTQWADLIGFLHKPMIVSKDKDAKFSRGIDANQGRVLEIERAPAWTAKNRYDLVEPIPIPLEQGWNYLAQAIYTKHSAIDVFNRELSQKTGA